MKEKGRVASTLKEMGCFLKDWRLTVSLLMAITGAGLVAHEFTNPQNKDQSPWKTMTWETPVGAGLFALGGLRTVDLTWDKINKKRHPASKM